MIRIQLDSVRKNRNASEWRKVGRAWCKLPGTAGTTLQSVGDAENIAILCRSLLRHGVTGPAEVYRGQIAVFSRPIDIEQFAAGKWGKGEQPEQLRKRGAK